MSTVDELSTTALVLRTALAAVEAQMTAAPVPVVTAPAPAGTAPPTFPLPTVIFPPTVEVDPMATVAYVDLTLSAPPTTTAIVEVMSQNGDTAMMAWQGGQFSAFDQLVVWRAGGPAKVTVAVPLIPSAANAGRQFYLGNPQADNPGTATGTGRTSIVFKAGAVNVAGAPLAPAVPPTKGALVYQLDTTKFAASDTGGPGVFRDRFATGRTQDGNGELGYYADPTLDAGTSPYVVRNGLLVLRAEHYATPKTFEARSWNYGAAVLCAPWLSQTYGYYEVEALTSTARGTWPAFWLLPSDDTWPPELDVFEHPRNGQITPRHTTGTQHWKDPATGQAQAVGMSADLAMLWGKAVDLSDGFHTYGLDWRADYTRWYVDGVEIWATPTRFTKAAYPILDIAVGGWAGTPDFTTGTTELQVRALRVYA